MSTGAAETVSRGRAAQVDWRGYGAVLFDLDGVITPTATVHQKAWTEMFDAYLATVGQPPFTESDYHTHVDGKPRVVGTADFLASRGILLPTEDLVDLSNRKNEIFTAVLARDGVEPYPGSVALLDHLAGLGTPCALVSSSANAVQVVTAAGLRDRFAVVVDGVVAKREGLEGKPSPETYRHAARLLAVPAQNGVVVEDAVSGVRAGAAGGFGLVVGVDRGVGADALLAAGAHLVVDDLAELVPGAGA